MNDKQSIEVLAGDELVIDLCGQLTVRVAGHVYILTVTRDHFVPRLRVQGELVGSVPCTASFRNAIEIVGIKS